MQVFFFVYGLAWLALAAAYGRGVRRTAVGVAVGA
jgi:hypothetical protein